MGLEPPGHDQGWCWTPWVLEGARGRFPTLRVPMGWLLWGGCPQPHGGAGLGAQAMLSPVSTPQAWPPAAPLPGSAPPSPCCPPGLPCTPLPACCPDPR